MKEENWYENLIEQAKQDPHYQACLKEVKRLEPQFLALRDGLSQEKQNLLEEYLSACEELDHALLLLSRKVRE